MLQPFRSIARLVKPGDGLGVQSHQGEQFVGGAGFAESIPHAHTLKGDARARGEMFCDCPSESSDDGVILCCHQGPAGGCHPVDEVSIQRFDGVDIDDGDVDTLRGERKDER